MTKAGLQFLGPHPRAPIVDALVNSGINVKGVVTDSLKPGEELGLMLDIASRSRGHIHVARVFPYDEEVSQACKNAKDPRAAAQKWVARTAALANGNPYLKALWWETGPNEPGREYLAWVNRYATEVIKLSQNEGLKICWGNFSAGNPDYPDWPILGDALDATKRTQWGRVLLGLHEYGVIAPMSSPQSAHHVLRFRRMELHGLLIGIPKAITELNNDPPVRGNLEQELEQFRWYDMQVRDDPSVVAWYGYCLPNPAGEWEHFALDNKVGDEIVADTGRAGGSVGIALSPAPQPAPAPEPPTDEYPYRAVVQTGGDNLNLRAGPSTRTVTLTKMPHGAEVEIIGRQGDWRQLRYTVTGWAHNKYLTRRD